ncbi:ribonuclease P protein subunit p20 [Haematobia irritans]|uniref:ribonuclease P protein subunit p20 n=1 Tax=Haematobia irritans TaxID=7368 RepID=UPI003F509BBF
MNSLHRKKIPTKPQRKRQNDIYITAKSNYKAQQTYCKNLLNSGLKEIYIHCLGNAVNRGLNLALDLVVNSNDTLTYSINTSTIQLTDEYHPLCDDEDVTIQKRNNSAIHIKIIRNSILEVDGSSF